MHKHKSNPYFKELSQCGTNTLFKFYILVFYISYQELPIGTGSISN